MTPRRTPATVRAARWSARHPKRTIGLWLLFVVAAIAVGSTSGVHQQGTDDGLHGQSAQAASWLRSAHLEQPDTEDVLITARSGQLDRDGALRAASDVRDRMAALPQVAGVAAPLTSPDGSAVLVEVRLREGVDDAAPVLAATAAVQASTPGLRVEEVGSVSFDRAVNEQVASDLGTAARLSLPLTLAILLVAFGTVVAAGVPVLLALSAVGSSIGLSSLVSHVIPDSGSTSSMILLMGMAVGVDYSLFYVTRARRELRAGRSRLDAVEIAAATSGHSVLVSGLAVVVSMAGLFLATDLTFASLAAGSIVVVAVAVVGSLTVLPAMLVLLGGRLDRLRVPLLSRRVGREPRLWGALLRPVLAHPGRSLVAGLLVLGALALPALGLRLAADSPRSLPAVIPETASLARLTAAFPGQSATDEVVVRAPAAAATEVTDRLDALGRRGGPGLVAGSAVLTPSADGSVHVLRLDVPADPESTRARASVTSLRAALPAVTAGIPGARAAVGGDAAVNLDTDRHLADRLPWVVAAVVGVTTIVMVLVFGSAVVALLTAAVNLLSAGAAFGLLALVFQHHWMDGVLGYTSIGAVINWIPLFTFGVLFGLSMDYHVFVLSHVREALAEGRPIRDAVHVGLTRSAGPVTSAAAVMVSVFALFAGLHLVEMKELGLGLAAAVLLDAVLVRLVILPTALCLLGRRAWGRSIPAPRPSVGADLVGATS